MLPGIAPVLHRKAPGGGSGYSFNMTAGTSGGVTGYDPTGIETGGIGSLDAEPVPGQTLRYLLNFGSGYVVMSFAGDLVALLSGLQFYVNGVLYPWSFPWYLDGSNTAAEISSGGPTFTGTNLIEIK